MEVVNLTPHDVTVMPIDGSAHTVFTPDPAGPLRLSTIELGTQPLGFENGAGAVPVELVEFHHLLKPPPRVEGTWYIVSLPCALAAPRPDFLVPFNEVRDDAGRIIGCRLLARPV